jgi:multiple antibiotic resistance protein
MATNLLVFMIFEKFFSYSAATFLALLPIANPLGAIPIFYSLTIGDTPRYRQLQARKTAINVIWVLIIFLIAGRVILAFLGISLGVLRIAGGLLIAHTAWEMVTVRQRLTKLESSEAADKEDISFTPMAVPMVSGPGAIGVVIGFAARTSQWQNYLGCIVGIVGLGITLYLCLVLGDRLLDALGKIEIGALNRVLGFFILAIAVQFIADGSFDIIQENMPELWQQLDKKVSNICF